MEHWSNDVEHPSITGENREAFNTAMSKFPTKDDVAVGYMELQKTAGKPFKMPESLDKLPDDASRVDFTSQAHKLLGIEHAVNIEALAGLDMKVGQAEGAPFDEDLANAFKAFVVEKKINKANAQEMVGFHNLAMAKARIARDAQIEAQKLEAATKTNDALVAHFGSKEKVAEQSELLRRVVQNKMDLTAAEYEEFGDAIADAILTKNPAVAKGLLKVLAPLAAEASTDTGGGGTPPEKPKDPDEGSKTYQALGWSPKTK